MIVVCDSNRLCVEHMEPLVRWRAPKDGPSSSRWVICPRCASYKGDSCRDVDGLADDFDHPERQLRNHERMLLLKTWGIEFATPCCRQSIWLCWRSAEDVLQWNGVPCTCGKTYEVQRNASDYAIEQRSEFDRLNPQLVEMTCWAITT